METGPARGLQVSNCNLTTPDFLAAGPVSKLLGSNCNLTTPDFCLAAGPVSMLRGSNCYLTIPGGPSLLKVSLSPRFSGLQFVTGLLRSFSVLRHIVSGSEMIWLVSLVSDRPSCSSPL